MKYICILRGINVGGKRKILMAELKAMFSDLGFENVSTYIQSGNVFFDSEKTPSEVEVSNKIKDQFGFEVPVIIISAEVIKKIVKQNPYSTEPIEKLHVTFLNEKANAVLVNELENLDFSTDQFTVNNICVYLNIDGKYHKSKLTNNFFEKKLKVTATTRNWKTVLKLVELSV